MSGTAGRIAPQKREEKEDGMAAGGEANASDGAADATFLSMSCVACELEVGFVTRESGAGTEDDNGNEEEEEEEEEERQRFTGGAQG